MFTKCTCTGRTSPPQMPLVNNTIGNYTSVVITFEQPVYGHECATGYSAEFDQRSERSITTTILVSRLNLCKVTYTFSIVALTSSGVNGEPVSANSSVPDFAGQYPYGIVNVYKIRCCY